MNSEPLSICAENLVWYTQNQLNPKIFLATSRESFESDEMKITWLETSRIWAQDIPDWE